MECLSAVQRVARRYQKVSWPHGKLTEVDMFSGCTEVDRRSAGRRES